MKKQRMAYLRITGAMLTMPTAGMETLSGLEPIECNMREDAIVAGLRLNKNKENNDWRDPKQELTC